MNSKALQTFNHAIQDSVDLLNHFDNLNQKSPGPDTEVLKRASLVMALAALESYFEDVIREAIEVVCRDESAGIRIRSFYRNTLDVDLKSFHSPSSDRVRALFKKYLTLDISEAWLWNHCDPVKARAELNRLVKKRGDIAHRSLRPNASEPQPSKHAVTRDDLRRHIHFVRQLAETTDSFLIGRNLVPRQESRSLAT